MNWRTFTPANSAAPTRWDALPVSASSHYAHDAGMARERDLEQARAEAWEADEAAQEAAENAWAGWDDWTDPNG